MVKRYLTEIFSRFFAVQGFLYVEKTNINEKVHASLANKMKLLCCVVSYRTSIVQDCLLLFTFCFRELFWFVVYNISVTLL